MPSALYVHARPHLSHGGTPSKIPTIISHAAALALAPLLAWFSPAPPLVVLAFFILLARAAAGLRTPRGEGSARRVGVGEIASGALTVLTAANPLRG